MSINVITSGRFFLPFSEFQDGVTLACYYTRFCKERDGNEPVEYPLSISIGDNDISIYWHGHLSHGLEHTKQDYSVSKVFSFSFSSAHNKSFEDWLNNSHLIPSIKADSLKYNVDYDLDQKESIINKSFFHLFPRIDSDHNANHTTNGFPISVQQFFLDLLYDISFSNVFLAHPRYNDIVDFIKSIPLSQCILLKAKYLKSISEYEKSRELGHEEQVTFNKKRLEEYRKEWLRFLRTPEGEKGTKYGLWFKGVENEHNQVYSRKELASDDLRKEAEDSLQWLLSRYNMYRAYSFQFLKIYNNFSKLVWGFFAFAIFVYVFCGFIWRETEFSLKGGFQFSFLCLFYASVAIASATVSMLVLERMVSLIPSIFRRNHKGHSWSDILSSLPKLLLLIKPRILLASGAVWTFLFTSDIDMLWKLEFKLNLASWIGILMIFIIAYIFVTGRLNNFITEKSQSRFWIRTGRSLLVIVLATVYSFTIGLIGMSINGKKKVNDLNLSLDMFEPYSNKLKKHKEQDLFISDSLTSKTVNKDEVFEKLLPLFHHDSVLSDRVCLVIPVKNKYAHFNIFAIMHTLVFFTFVSVAIGLLLEMGLKTEDMGIDFG